MTCPLSSVHTVTTFCQVALIFTITLPWRTRRMYLVIRYIPPPPVGEISTLAARQLNTFAENRGWPLRRDVLLW